MQDFSLPYGCDDGTLLPDSPTARLSNLCQQAGAAAGRPMDLGPKYASYLSMAGFTDVVERRFKWPLNEWPKDRHYKELGAWTHENISGGLEGLLLALFTRFLGWTRDEVLVYCSEARAALRDRRVHAYMPM